MVIAFKLNKNGSRYMPKPQRKDALTTSRAGGDGVSSSSATKLRKEEGSTSTSEGEESTCENFDASFAVNLLPDGFSVEKPTEEGKNPPYGYELADAVVYPYDRTSERFLSAIDCGYLPTELLDDIPCTYVDGCVVCELRDYRDSVPSSYKREAFTWKPKVHKVLLRPSTENIVKDIVAMSDDNWSYKDFLDVESKVLKAVKPSLCLDPSPSVAAKAHIHTYNRLKFNLGISSRRYRMHRSALMDRRTRIAGTRLYLSKQGSISKLASLPDKVDTPGNDTKSDHSVEIIQDLSGVVQSKPRIEKQLETGNMHTGLMRTSPSPLSPTASTTLYDVFGKRERERENVKFEANKRPRQEPVKYYQQQNFVKQEEQQQQQPSEELLQMQQMQRNQQQWPGFDLKTAKKEDLLKWKQSSLKAASPVSHITTESAVLSPTKNIQSVPPQVSVAPGPLDHLQFNHNRHMLVKTSSSPNVVNSPSTPVPSPSIKTEQSHVGISQNSQSSQLVLPQNPQSSQMVLSQNSQTSQTALVPKAPVDSMAVLVSCIEKHGLHKREKKVDQLPPPRKTSTWQSLAVALADTSDDYQEPKGKKSLANTLIGGNVNGRKTRCLQFERTERVIQFMGGQAFQALHVTRLRFLLCGRGKDNMVEAVIQIGDDQEDENIHGQLPYTVLPTIPNADAADLFARQYIAVLEKEGFTLTDDMVQLSTSQMPRGSAMMSAAAARPLPAGASTFGQQQSQQAAIGSASPRMMLGQHVAQMQQMNAARMPPPSMAGNRLAYGMSQPVSKPLQLDSSQLVQQQMLQHQQFQRPLMNQLSMQYMIRNNPMNSRKMMGMGGNIGSMVGLNTMNNAAGMANMGSMGGINALNMGQLPGVVPNLSVRPGGMNAVNQRYLQQQQQKMAALNAAAGRGGAVGPRLMTNNMAAGGLSAGTPTGLNMLTAQARGNLSAIRSPVPGMPPPKTPGPGLSAAQFYMSQQFSPQQQQQLAQQANSLNQQQLNAQLMATQQQQLTNQLTQQQQQMQPTSVQQQQLVATSPQMQPASVPQPAQTSLNQPSPQQMAQQQQIMNTQAQLNSQVFSVGTPGAMVSTPAAGVGTPSSPQVSSQTALPPNSPMEMQSGASNQVRTTPSPVAQVST